jgi:hypothetical protein
MEYGIVEREGDETRQRAERDGAQERERGASSSRRGEGTREKMFRFAIVQVLHTV